MTLTFVKEEGEKKHLTARLGRAISIVVPSITSFSVKTKEKKKK